MPLEDLTQIDWAKISEKQARAECEALARTLPHPLKFIELKDHYFAGRAQRLALFDLEESEGAARFALVPGGETQLGYDGANFQPTAWQIMSYDRRSRDYYSQETIWQEIEARTSPARKTDLSPLLVEVSAREVTPRDDLERVPADDPRLEALRDSHWVDEEKCEHYGGLLGEDRYVVVPNRNGGSQVWRRPPTTISVVGEKLAQDGMRLPTCDEWEFICSGGATTLFRWGDESPRDIAPDSHARFGDEQALKWTLHIDPNLFGLKIAFDPYRMDLVSEPPFALGGDGGCSICDGVGIFPMWLTLATAYRDAWEDRLTPGSNVSDEYHRLRRIIDLAA